MRRASEVDKENMVKKSPVDGSVSSFASLTGIASGPKNFSTNILPTPIIQQQQLMASNTFQTLPGPDDISKRMAAFEKRMVVQTRDLVVKMVSEMKVEDLRAELTKEVKLAKTI